MMLADDPESTKLLMQEGMEKQVMADECDGRESHKGVVRMTEVLLCAGCGDDCREDGRLWTSCVWYLCHVEVLDPVSPLGRG